MREGREGRVERVEREGKVVWIKKMAFVLSIFVIFFFFKRFFFSFFKILETEESHI